MNTTVQALGWTLIHFCWQAAAITVAYRLIDASISRARAHIRYLLSLSTVMSLLVVAAATYSYEQKRVDVESMSYALVASDGRTIYAEPDCNVPRMAIDSSGNTNSTLAMGRRIAGDLSDRVVRSIPGDLLTWIDGAWLLGVMAFTVRLMGGCLNLRRLRADSKIGAPPAVYAAFLRLAGRMGISRRVDLLLCQKISGPVAIGVMRAAVILPAAALCHLSPEQLEVVLAHELAHIRRADYLWNMLQTMVETLFFFHPAVWWLGSRTRQLRELCCDDEALAACGDPVVYATALLKLEEQRSLRIRVAMALHGSSGSLKSRILRILEGGQGLVGIGRRDSIPLSLAGVAAALCIFLLPLPHVMAGKTAAADQKAASKEVLADSPNVQESKAVVVEAKKQPSERHARIKDEAVESAVSPSVNVVPAVVTAIEPAPVAIVQPVVSISVPARIQAISSIAVQPRIVVGVAGISTMIASAAPVVTTRLMVAQTQAAGDSAPDRSYLQGMRNLGYTDVDKLTAMKVQGITVDYAERMSKAGYGAVSADDLIALKTFGVTPEEAEKFHADGVVGRASLKQLVHYKIFRITPEFAAEMKAAGFDSLPPDKMVALKVQNVTPAFAAAMKQRFPQLTVDQLIQMKIFRIDDEFIASAKSHGFDSLSLEKLIRLRVSGVLDDNSVQR